MLAAVHWFKRKQKTITYNRTNYLMDETDASTGLPIVDIANEKAEAAEKEFFIAIYQIQCLVLLAELDVDESTGANRNLRVVIELTH